MFETPVDLFFDRDQWIFCKNKIKIGGCKKENNFLNPEKLKEWRIFHPRRKEWQNYTLDIFGEESLVNNRTSFTFFFVQYQGLKIIVITPCISYRVAKFYFWFLDKPNKKDVERRNSKGLSGDIFD